MSEANGAAQKSSAAALVRRGGRDPMAGVLEMGPRMPVAATIALAIVMHAGVAAAATAAVAFADMFQWAHGVRMMVADRLAQTYDVDLEKPPEPPPPKEEPKEEPKEAPKADIPPPPKADDTPPPPPAAAEAAKVLTQDPDPKEPVDFGNTFVQGTGDTYAGGQTETKGTSKTAVYNPAATATGVPGGTGTAPAPPKPPPPAVDRSRPASLVNPASLKRCPFPGEADAEQIDEAYVLLDIKVRADGTAESVSVRQDPGHGFGREARKCAMRERYNPQLDVNGNPIPGVAAIRLHFDR